MTPCSQALILAGGLGTRLKPVTEAIPKSLVEVAKKPFIFHQLDLLLRNKVTEVVLLLGHLGEQVEQAIRDSVYEREMSIVSCYDGPVLLGTGGSIRNAIHLAKQSFFVLYGDSYLDCDYQRVYEKFIFADRPALMTVLKNDNQWDKSNVVFTGGEILFYSKKESRPDMAYIDYGLSVFDKNIILSHVPTGVPFDMADLLAKLLQEGRLSAYEVNRRFYEIGSFQGIASLEDYLSRSAQGSPNKSTP